MMTTPNRKTRGVIYGLAIAAALAVAAPAASAGVFDDPGFSGDGTLLLQEKALVRGVAIQPDGKIVLAGDDIAHNYAVWRLLPDGSLDRSFSGDGRAIVDAGGEDYANAVAVAPDGKIVVAGVRRTGLAIDDFAVVRLESDGDPDPTFNPAGTRPGVKALEGDAYDRAEEVVVQPDGKIVVAGRGRDDYAIARLEVDGDVDGTTFELDGPAGLVTVDTLALDGAGRILAAESSGVARFLGSGALDDTFAGDGTAPTPKDTSQVFDVLIEPGGRIVIAGDAGDVDTRMFLGRLTAKGELDTTFGSGGTAAPEFEGAEVSAAVARQADGKLLLVGTTAEAGVTMAVARYDAKGALDTSYGNGGRLTLAFGFPAAAGDAAIQPDGKLVVAGVADVGTNDPRPAVARLLAAPRVQDPGPGGVPGPGPGSGDPGPGGDLVTTVVPTCAGEPATIVGTARGETLRGTAGNDVIVARGGADRIRAGRGRDLVCGGRGRDVLSGGRGADRLLGGAGRDRCLGGTGRDRGASCERPSSL
jgi:uncharacterized delta-60 repeat protein